MLCVMVATPCISAATFVPYIPQVINYSVGNYKAGNQNWAVAQASNGFMYFGNNRGLLQFDGIRWSLYKLPNSIVVRSVYIAQDGRIYVGSFEEFGYFEKDERNQLVYHSLKELVKGYQFRNDDIWSINEHQGNIYFQSFTSFFVYNGKEVQKGVSERPPLYFFSLNGKLYAQFIEGGFNRLGEEGFEELIAREQIGGDDIVSVLPFDDKLLLLTATSGLYLYSDGQVEPWQIPASELLKAGIANRATMMKDSSYVVGTISDGLVAFSKQGETLWHINRENHLLNNTILGLYTDEADNLWVAMDNGIAHIQVSSSLYFYEPMEAQIGMVHDMAINKDGIYLASNQGVYFLSNMHEQPRLVPGSKEQTWYITEAGNQLIAGHNKGTLLVENLQAKRIAGPSSGGTALRKCMLHGKEVMLQVSYNAISIFTRDASGHWVFSHNVSGFDNLIKSFEVDPAGNIWASHMYKGIYRIMLDESLERVKETEYIGKLDPANQEGMINVMKLRGRIVLTDGKKFYTYEDLSRRIVPYEILNKDFPEMSDTYRIVSLNNDLYWFIRNTEYVQLGYEAGKFVTKVRIPFTLFDNPTIEDRGNIYIGPDGASYFCLNGGIARYNQKQIAPDTTQVPLSLSSVRVYNRHDNMYQQLPCKEVAASAAEALSYLYNNITFEFSYPDYSGRHSRILYKLEGFDNEWTEGSADFTKSYSNLPYGDFKMHAMIDDGSGNEMSTLTYAFTVGRPFYRSLFAFIVYFVLVIFVLVTLVKTYITWEVARENKAAEEQQRLQQEQLKAQEQLIIQLENEKLENELTYKSKELASATLSVISHNEFLEGMKKEIQTQQLSGSYSKRFFEKLVRMIDDSLADEDEWVVFQTNFDRIHENFFVKLKSRYPDLTSGDLRMCALLRLNMPTKDMARMQNLSVRGIEAARYRLRKKLNLPEGQSLVDFMIGFS